MVSMVVRFSTGNPWAGNSVPIPVPTITIPVWPQCGMKPIWCCRNPWVCPPPTSLQPCESSPHMSIDVVAHFTRYWHQEEEEEKDRLTYLYMQPHKNSLCTSIDIAAHFVRCLTGGGGGGGLTYPSCALLLSLSPPLVGAVGPHL